VADAVRGGGHVIAGSGARVAGFAVGDGPAKEHHVSTMKAAAATASSTALLPTAAQGLLLLLLRALRRENMYVLKRETNKVHEISQRGTWRGSALLLFFGNL
jgi:hypothetical protein